MVHVYVRIRVLVRPSVRTYHGTYNGMSQLSDWKRAHMCTENHVRTYVRTYVLIMLCHNLCTMVHTRVHYLSNDLKYKPSGATGKPASGRCQHMAIEDVIGILHAPAILIN